VTGIRRANSVGGWHLRLEGVVEMKRDAVLEFTVCLVDHDVGVTQCGGRSRTATAGRALYRYHQVDKSIVPLVKNNSKNCRELH